MHMTCLGTLSTLYTAAWQPPQCIKQAPGPLTLHVCAPCLAATPVLRAGTKTPNPNPQQESTQACGCKQGARAVDTTPGHLARHLTGLQKPHLVNWLGSSPGHLA